MNAGEIATEQRYWPLCPVHAAAPLRIWRDWAYCAGHGWHVLPVTETIGGAE